MSRKQNAPQKPTELSDESLDTIAGGEGQKTETAMPAGEILSNVSKTRSEISMTFARNARA